VLDLAASFPLQNDIVEQDEKTRVVGMATENWPATGAAKAERRASRV